MRRNPRLFRLTASVALTALLWDTLLPLSAIAQPAPPPLPQPSPAQPNQFQGDPPSRVGRVARLTGTVSFHNEGDTQWSPASINYPVSSGNAFWTEPSAEAQLEISDSRIVLAGTTEFDIATLDNDGLQAVVAQGEVFIRLRDRTSNEAWSIQTPRGLVRLEGDGRYDIVAGTTEQPTLVTVVEGSAQVDGPGVSLRVGSGQTATISGTDSFQGSVGPAERDAFLTARLDAERPRPTPPVQIPAGVAVMPGGSDLTNYGNWSEAPDYGQVWYPPVAAGWVPYREGHWAYVAPWGWTWIDDAPWGFAPFHYGRWIEIGGRWAWTPGGYAVAGPPVYAPALVTFIGIGAGVALGAALASRSIGWVPLGPREPFRPWYRASDRYRRDVNINHVTNINNNVTINNFVNRRAATSIPATAMEGSRPVQSVARPFTQQEFAAARPIVGQQPIRPSVATAGITPSVARQLNLGSTAGVVRPAPGPMLRARAPGPTANGFARPAIAPPGGAEPSFRGAGENAPIQTPRPGGLGTAPGPAAPGAPPAVVPPPLANPAFRGAGGNAPIQTPRPGGLGTAPGPATPGAPPAVVPPPQANPAFRGAGGNAPIQTPRPGGLGTTPGPATPGAPPAVVPPPQANRPVQLPPAVNRSTQPNFARTPQPAPASPSPAINPGGQGSVPRAEPHALPQVITPSRQEPPHFAAPSPRTEPPRAIAPAPRMEPQHAAPAAPPIAPRVEAPHFAPPAPVARPEPPHFAPPAARPEPARQAPPAPAARAKRPGEP